MDKKNKNPLLAGLMNVLIPGSSQLYVNKDRGKFIRGFGIGAVALIVAVLLGNLIQNTRGYTLPQGACMGSLVMTVAVVLFFSGRKAAKERNSETVDAAHYNSMRRGPNESGKTKQTAAKQMRDKGLISKQEYEDKNEDAEPKTK